MKEPVRPAKIVDSPDPRWYACYTRPRAEKITEIRLKESGVECYLPLQRIRRRWSDRIKWVDEPLIRSYIFVRVSSGNYNKVLYIEGFRRFITFENRAVPIPDEQIQAVQRLLGEGVELEVTSENFKPGHEVEVVAGPLIGLKGELIEIRGRKRVLVRLGQIGQGILVTIEAGLLSRV